MGSQGILKSTDAGATWTVLGAGRLRAGLHRAAGPVPAVRRGRQGARRPEQRAARSSPARRRASSSPTTAASTGPGPCTTNGFATQRQDITGLELVGHGRRRRGSSPRSACAASRRPSSTTSARTARTGSTPRTMPASGCPTFTLDRVERERVRLRQRRHRQPVHDRRGDERGQRRQVRQPDDGRPARPDRHRRRAEQPERHLRAGAVDRPEHRRELRQRARLPARRLGDRRTAARPGRSWPARRARRWAAAASTTRRTGTTRGSRSTRTTPTASSSTRTTSGSRPAPARRSTDLTCGYQGTSGHVVHVDQHALAFVNGSSSILLVGSDGGAFSTLNANVADATDEPTWINMVSGLNTIEFYSGDISGNFANSPNPSAAGGAQDNAPERRRLHGLPDRPGAVADDDRRRRLLRPHRPGRAPAPARAAATSSATTAAACRAASRPRAAPVSPAARATRASAAAGPATRSRSSCPSTSSTAASRAATTARRPASRAAAATSSPARPGSGRRSPAATRP